MSLYANPENWNWERDPPCVPHPADMPEIYDWPIDPLLVDEARRAYAIEAYVMQTEGWDPEHTRWWDARDDAGRTIEIVHTVTEYGSGRDGRLHVTRRQEYMADRLAWLILRRDWSIEWQAVAAMDDVRVVLRDFRQQTGERRCPWTALRDYLVGEELKSLAEQPTAYTKINNRMVSVP